MTYSFSDWREQILEALENGAGLENWSKAKEGRPSRNTIIRWMDNNPEFELQCARAREWAGDLAAEKHNQVMEDCLAGKVPPDIAGRVLSGMQWRAAKLAHRRFGEKLDLTHAGGIKSERELTEADRALIDLAIEHKINGGKDGKTTS